MIGTQVICARYEAHVGRVVYLTIATIEKVYKNGNVVIAGVHWRSNRDGRSFHCAGKSSGFYNRSYYVVYDDETKAKVAENEAHFNRQRRLRDVQAKIANVRDLTEEQLAKIEEALNV